MPRQSRLNLLISGAILASLAFYAMLGFPSPRDVRNWWFEDRYLRQCRSNLKNLGTACEMYSTDNGHRSRRPPPPEYGTYRSVGITQ